MSPLTLTPFSTDTDTVSLLTLTPCLKLTLTPVYSDTDTVSDTDRDTVSTLTATERLHWPRVHGQRRAQAAATRRAPAASPQTKFPLNSLLTV